MTLHLLRPGLLGTARTARGPLRVTQFSRTLLQLLFYPSGLYTRTGTMVYIT